MCSGSVQWRSPFIAAETPGAGSASVQAPECLENPRIIVTLQPPPPPLSLSLSFISLCLSLTPSFSPLFLPPSLPPSPLPFLPSHSLLPPSPLFPHFRLPLPQSRSPSFFHSHPLIIVSRVCVCVCVCVCVALHRVAVHFTAKITHLLQCILSDSVHMDQTFQPPFERVILIGDVRGHRETGRARWLPEAAVSSGRLSREARCVDPRLWSGAAAWPVAEG